jgi:SAM-dependent methyltransferase
MSRDGEDMATGFTAGEAEWRARLGTLRQIVRQELVARRLAAHLPSPPARILDVGCGQGTQLLRLARHGHRVTGMDSSATLLADLAGSLAEEPADVRERVRTVRADAGDLASLFPSGAFEAVLDRLADLTASLASHGLAVRAWYGVRVFTDVAASDAPPPAGLDALLACEERAGRTDPYRGVAALTHVIAAPA